VLCLQRLVLTDFRNYASLTWRLGAGINVLYGPNGSGKTNLLEAVSLLVPGRGLRGARNADLARRDGNGGWAVAGRLLTVEGETDIGTGTPGPTSAPNSATPGPAPATPSPNPGMPGPNPGMPSPPGPPGLIAARGTPAGTAPAAADRRVFRVDGATPRSQAEIAARAAVVWLTPQMDRLFQEGPSGRRRFLDRLVWALEPGHAREMAAHDAAMSSRNRLLAEGRHDRAWLAGLEDAMARHAVAATAARTALVARLNAALSGNPDHRLGHLQARPVAGGFPAARIDLVCPIAERLAETPALAVEDWLRAGLAANRPRDTAAGTARLGAHRTDLALADAATGTAAALASTGEQKSLLIGVILAHAALITETRGFAPLLLLDEPAVHLDPERRRSLFDALVHLPAQILLTGTDGETFLPLAQHAMAWRAGAGAVMADPRFSCGETRAAPVLTTL
jgi:DNA replication and repair protein RecF